MQIETIEDCAVVEKPGAYRMSMEWYHQQCCAGPSVSSSGLRKIIAESPWHFFASWGANPNAYEQKRSDALDFGRAAHCLILGDEVFEENYAVRPVEFKDWRKKEAVEWRDEHVMAGKTVLTPDQVIAIGHMAENLAKSPEAKESLTGSLLEVSMLWQDDISGVWLKSRPDVIPSNGYDFADLKTFSPTSRHNYKRIVQRAITDHGYAMQMALAVMGAEAVLGTTAERCILIFVQSTAPYTVIPAELDDEALYWGRVRVRHAIDTFAQCVEKNEWPGPVEGIMTYTIPPSLQSWFSEQQMEGNLPNLER